jgi:hypothetical protein
MSSVTATYLAPYLAVRVEKVAVERTAKPLHVGFLLDVSYSMSGERLAAVKKTLTAIAPMFRLMDFCTVVTFSSAARTVVNHLQMDEPGIGMFLSAVSAIEVEGNTDLGTGITHMASLPSDYDAVIILTDGEITAGVSSNEGIMALLAAFRGSPIHTLGYGADHNRALLNRVAIHSCATYTYVDSETTLPLSMADLLEGLRTEVLHNAQLCVDGIGIGATSIELNGVGGARRIGGIVPDRPYWSIFKIEGGIEGATVTLTSTEEIETITTISREDRDGDVQEQIIRARVAAVLQQGVTFMENMARGVITTDLEPQIQSLLTEIGASTRPLMLRMKGQLIDMRCALRDLPPPPFAADGFPRAVGGYAPPPPALARFTSVTGVLSSQRGVTRYHDGEDADQTFSSPTQRSVSHQVSQHYTAADDPV